MSTSAVQPECDCQPVQLEELELPGMTFGRLVRHFGPGMILMMMGTLTTENWVTLDRFHVHDGVWVAAADREFAVRLARYCARNPVALSRLEYQSDNQSDNATLT